MCPAQLAVGLHLDRPIISHATAAHSVPVLARLHSRIAYLVLLVLGRALLLLFALLVQRDPLMLKLLHHRLPIARFALLGAGLLLMVHPTAAAVRLEHSIQSLELDRIQIA